MPTMILNTLRGAVVQKYCRVASRIHPQPNQLWCIEFFHAPSSFVFVRTQKFHTPYWTDSISIYSFTHFRGVTFEGRVPYRGEKCNSYQFRIAFTCSRWITHYQLTTHLPSYFIVAFPCSPYTYASLIRGCLLMKTLGSVVVTDPWTSKSCEAWITTTCIPLILWNHCIHTCIGRASIRMARCNVSSRK